MSKDHYRTRRAGEVYTTGQVARICKVASRTVSKWFDSGRLRGYRIPGSTDRRIPRDNLVRFLTQHGMPVPHELGPWAAPAAVSPDPDLLALLGRRVAGLEAHASLVSLGFASSAACGRVLLDTSLGASAVLAALPPLVGRNWEAYVLCREDEADPGRYRAAGAAGVWVWPCDLDEVARALVAGGE